MNRKYKNAVTILVIGCLICFSGCKKFLDEKTNKKLAVPNTISDLQALMDNPSKINSSSPCSGEISTDDYYLTDAKWASIAEIEQRRMYNWEKDNLFARASNDWSKVYMVIYYSNTVLEGLSTIPRTPANAPDWDNVKGQAYYCRGSSYLEAVNVWSLAYDPASSGADLGLPLRLNTNFSEVSVRANVQQTFDQLIHDIKASIPLLPVVPLSKFRPSKPAAYGLLGRAYLTMRDYENAYQYADSCLSLKSDLVDYNTLSVTDKYPFSFENNKESMYFKSISTPPIIVNTIAIISPELFNSYDASDLRKRVFFKKNTDNTYRFTGSYGGLFGYFGGVATDEMFLIKAECLARKGRVTECMDVLNKLLITRWDKTKVYVPYAATSPADALSLVLKERRKELVNRGLRWVDVKRLNKEGAGITMIRTLNNTVYKLLPNDLRSALPIPDDVIVISGMEQNKR
ncbi:RagB/SusD family nutrient uptake outer membrane protein [Pedobacter sp. PAMC26386]|nr:RagB/SusD family nutrient uptake outer membrane protein [Pedobacter sp. PAMC26386]